MSDEEVERSLLTGQNAGILEDYFGPVQFQELRRLEQAASSRSVRGGDRVLILPGIMGSRLGHPRLILPDIIWFDPIDIALGRLRELSLGQGGSRTIKAVGVILFAYLSLKLKLRIAGFDADFVPFDWRKSLKQLGKELAERIAKDGRTVHIVAHSMGGLVARSSLSHKPNISRIVMLGTPNFGSFAPVQAVRGAYSVVRRIAQLDQRHSIEQLALIFGGFPGLMEMIPTPGTAGSSDLFDLANWPEKGVRPTQPLLTAAKNVQASLPTAGVNTAGENIDIVMIAGVNRETVVDARRGEKDEFIYTVSNDGDGTVPLRCALLPSARQTYYVEADHGAMPNNGQIQQALPSIIATGETKDLATEPPQRRLIAERTVAEADLIPPPAAVAGGQMPSVREQRMLLAELAAPEERAEPLASVAAPVAAAAAAPPAAQAPGALGEISDMIVVGRGRQRRLEITLAHGSIVDCAATCYVTGLFKTVAPGGAADALDQLMGGAISDLVARRMFGANVGEVSILPNGSYPMRAKSVAFVGLGSFDSFAPKTLDIVGENVVRTFVAGGVNDFAMVPFGGGSFPVTAEGIQHLMAGFIRGLLDADKDQRFRGITICETDPDRFAFIRDTLFGLSHTTLVDEVEITFRDRKLEPLFSLATRAKAPETERVYLIVREAAESYADPNEKPPLIASVLTSGDKAAIHSGEQPSDDDGGDLERQLAKLEDIGDMTEKGLETFGTELANLVLAENVRQALAYHPERHLVVVHDSGGSRIPWETLRIGDGFPALRGGISHRYEASNLSVAKWLESRQQNERLSILLIVDPTKDLAGAVKEGKQITTLAQALGTSVSLRTLVGDEARKTELLTCFGSGEFDVVHYAGHAFFDPKQRSRSGLLCAGREVLSGADLAGVGNLPSLMFFNACEAARVRGEVENGGPKPTKSEVVERSIGFAESLLRGGIANFIGTYWPVGDSAAENFAREFYRRLLQSASLNDALKGGREAVKQEGSPDWADYVFYGDPDFRLKLPAAGR